MPDRKINDLFSQPIRVINVGLESMAQAVHAQGVPVIDVDWQPPAGDYPPAADAAMAWTSTRPTRRSASGSSGRSVLVGWASPGT